MVAAIELANVARCFGETWAVRDLTLSCEVGKVSMLLGPNGAGKTTALRIVTGALPPTAGSVRVFGLDPATQGDEVRRRCGIVPARPALYDRLSGRDNLKYAAELYQVAAKDHDERITAAAQRFDILDALDRPAGGYSTGMRARLALARAVLHEPELLLLDEPTAGLDPESSRTVLKLIGEYTRTGITVVMSTHLLIEAEGLADHAVVMDHGVVLEAGPPDVLRRKFFPRQVCSLDATDRTALKAAMVAFGIEPIDSPDGQSFQPLSTDQISDLIRHLVEHGIALTKVDPHHASLDELYFEIRRHHQEARR